MAAGAIARRCGRSELTPEFIRQPEVQDFFGKVSARTTSDKSIDEPSLAPFDRVTLTLRSGATLVSEPVRFPRGHFKNPVDPEALAEKFLDCASTALTQSQARQLFAILQAIAGIESTRSLSDFF